MISSAIPAAGPGPASLLHEARALQAAGRHAEAEAAYRRLLAQMPQHAEALHALGVLAYQAGRLPDAADLIGRALAVEPGNVHALNNRGLVLAGLGRFAEAIESYDRAIALRPDAPDALSNRGTALRELGRHAEALASLDRALALRPGHVEAWSNRGLVLVALGRMDEALASHDRALALRPDLAQVHLNRANALRELRRLAEALAGYDRAIALLPDYAEAHCNRGTTLRMLERPAEALESLDRALALRPELAAAHCDRGMALTMLDRPAEALASFERAAALAPMLADAWSSRAAALAYLDRPAEALAALDRALALQPGDPAARYNKALLLLQGGHYAEAWPLYEARWRAVEGRDRVRGFAQPQWRGETLAGRTLLLHAEQGIGDTIQFCRYATLAAARAAAEGGRVILEASPLLRAVLATLPGLTHLVVQGETLPAFDLHCPLLSLPLAFGTTLATVPAPPAYLRADPGRLTRWAPLLATLPAPRVGLAWAGNPRLRRDRARSVPLAALLPLLGVGRSFVSLQKEARDGDRAVLAQAPQLRNLGPLFADFADTAAVIAQLDLVIAADTAVAHLAAAMGKPTWVMLPFHPDWRWLLDRGDSPWYPTVQLFRQPAPGDWNGVVGQMRAALATLPGGAAG